ncbi:LLM class flavin-dependent oxidoreductase [Spirillospora sp. NPDC047418]
MDHLAPPGGRELDLLEGWTVATALAIRTERLHIGHLVLCAEFRHPAMLAKMAASLDVLSGGRLELGLGWGAVAGELTDYGFPDPGPAPSPEACRCTSAGPGPGSPCPSSPAGPTGGTARRAPRTGSPDSARRRARPGSRFSTRWASRPVRRFGTRSPRPSAAASSILAVGADTLTGLMATRVTAPRVPVTLRSPAVSPPARGTVSGAAEVVKAGRPVFAAGVRFTEVGGAPPATARASFMVAPDSASRCPPLSTANPRRAGERGRTVGLMSR